VHDELVLPYILVDWPANSIRRSES